MDNNDFYSKDAAKDRDPYHYGGDSQFSQEENTYGYRKPGAAITSMVLGICSVSLWWYPFITSIPCIIMGIVAMVMASREQGRTDPKFHGFLKTGRITGLIGIIVASVYTLIFIILLISTASRRW